MPPPNRTPNWQSTSAHAQPPAPAVPARPNHTAPAILLSLFALLAGVIISSGRIPFRAAFDQKLYHLPTIRQFAGEWPTFDVWDYLSATTPAYHMLLATIMHFFGEHAPLLQAAAAAITALWLWLLAREGSTHARPALVVAACAPLLTCIYTLYPAVFILPDNLAWLGVTIMILLALRAPTARTLVLMGATLLALVCVRQVHAWTGGLILTSALLGGTNANASTTSRFSRTLFALLCCLPAAILLLMFVRYWGGLVPPRMQTWYTPLTPAQMLRSPAPVMFLGVLAIYSAFFLATLAPHILSLWKHRRAWLFAAALVGLLLALIPATTYSYDEGRRGVLWSLASKGPILFGRTALIALALSAWGSVCALAWCSALRARDRWVFAAAALGFVVSQCASAETWHRYYDPFMLLMLALLAPRAPRPEPSPTPSPLSQTIALQLPRLTLLGPICLTLFWAGLALREFTNPDVMTMASPPPPTRSAVHQGKQPPVELPVTPKPPGKHFWSF